MSFISEKKKKKKGKKGKGKSAKGKKEPAGTIDELFTELVTSGVVHGYPDVKLSDWKGDVSYQNVEARMESREVKRCLGDVIQPIMEYCILPIGSREIHQVTPLVRSVCIVGLPRSGKSFLVDAICSELGALLFDMTPNNIAESYKSKKDVERLVAVINKVARAYPPSIVFVDSGHQPWWKKIPPEEKANNPKRLAGPLAKLVKGIRPGDQVRVFRKFFVLSCFRDSFGSKRGRKNSRIFIWNSTTVAKRLSSILFHAAVQRTDRAYHIFIIIP